MDFHRLPQLLFALISRSSQLLFPQAPREDHLRLDNLFPQAGNWFQLLTLFGSRSNPSSSSPKLWPIACLLTMSWSLTEASSCAFRLAQTLTRHSTIHERSSCSRWQSIIPGSVKQKIKLMRPQLTIKKNHLNSISASTTLSPWRLDAFTYSLFLIELIKLNLAKINLFKVNPKTTTKTRKMIQSMRFYFIWLNDMRVLHVHVKLYYINSFACGISFI